jgi:CO/xanthine dehydrogenase FAD-binding subunit
VKPVAFDYVRARSLEEALSALADGGEDAKPLAGGQSLVPALNLRLVRPSLLVDLNRAGLDAIERDGELVLGATVRQAALADDPDVHPLVRAALPFVGHPGTRSRGTVGGSLAHADGAAELPVCLLALGGSVDVAGPNGTRSIAADELFVTHYTTTLAPGELVIRSRWPLPRADERAAFEELALRSGDYALSMVAVVLRLDGGGVVAEARVVVGAVSDRPTRLSEVEALVVGARPAEAATEAAALASSLVDPPDGLHASGRYLRSLTGTLVARALRRAA